ncbi:GNAT family N-acetyltransferase [Nocardia abscessus]|uniref:GNAT family N-acetyltransferase n=1 Tax=Nocardia abscessus TaxID=120957 RepID=UPI0018958232|nr:GNAT family N-acetyltransferase [Nocardia abscessus]MBF6221742.1 GNAT family N-acetyltransferase [Nocardia abscessus]
MVELRTDRLTLRQWRDSDLDAWTEMNADPEVRRYFPDLMSRAQSAAAMSRYQAEIEQRGYGWWAVEVRASGRFVGLTGLGPVESYMPFTGTEIGWRLARFAWGHAYATEAARACLAFGFDTLALSEIVAMTACANARSRAVMRRIGMRRDPADDFDRPGMPAGPLRRHVLYRVQAKEWRHDGLAGDDLVVRNVQRRGSADAGRDCAHRT